MPTIIIPARLASTRLKDKLLLSYTGYPLIWYTIQRALESRLVNDIIVATEDQSIADAVNVYVEPRVKVIMTPPCNSGTERISWVVNNIEGFDFSIVVNLQGDEPNLPGYYIDMLVEKLSNNHTTDIMTLVGHAQFEEYISNSVVKAVLDHNDNIMYFSRSPIPFGVTWSYAHIGIYAYKYEFLSVVSMLEKTTLDTEKLEQLQWLQSGFKIQAIKTDLRPGGIDIMPEYLHFVRLEKMKQAPQNNI